MTVRGQLRTHITLECYSSCQKLILILNFKTSSFRLHDSSQDVSRDQKRSRERKKSRLEVTVSLLKKKKNKMRDKSCGFRVRSHGYFPRDAYHVTNQRRSAFSIMPVLKSHHSHGHKICVINTRITNQL